MVAHDFDQLRETLTRPDLFERQFEQWTMVERSGAELWIWQLLSYAARCCQVSGNFSRLPQSMLGCEVRTKRAAPISVKKATQPGAIGYVREHYDRMPC